MSHFVPDFDLEENYSLHTSSAITRPKMSAMGEDDIMELVWHNGQVVMQSQAQRSYKKSDAPKFDDAVIPAGEHSSVREIRSSQDNHHQQQLFLQEEEMASWLHYPLQDNDFCADLLYPSSAACLISATPQPSSAAPFYYPNPSETRTPPPAARPPIPPSRKAEVAQNCSRRVSEANSRGREATVVDSSDTPAGGVSESIGRCVVGNCSSDNTTTITPTAAVTTTNDNSNKTSNNNNMTTCETTVTSSPGGSTATADDRKRKGRDEDVECHSEDADFESAEAKKSARGSASTKRSRAAEVHNLSERRRRDRINEKMRALQELIPRCNKSDKASMLDEAIEYLKSLQLQVQMMSMGCSMVPMMFPGVQQYMTPMGMGMGMGMGMNRPMMPFPNVLSSPSLPLPAAAAAAAAAAHLGPRFPMPAYQMPPVPSPDPSRIQASSQIDPMLSAMASHDPNQTRVPNFADPYQQYMSLHQMQVPMPQGQTMAPPSSSRPSTGEGPDTIDNHHTGT